MQNRLLSGLAADDLACLQPHLERVGLDAMQVLEAPDEPVRHIYFPESAIASVVALVGQGKRIEAGVFGREGMSGVPVMMGTDRSPQQTIVQVAGEAQCISADALRRAMAENTSLHARLLRYVQAFLVQTAQNVLATGSLSIEGRLARWLLMIDDRVEEKELALTHEVVAMMLGVRRAGVTTAINLLEAQGTVRARRGRILVTSREGLKKICAPWYGTAEAEYSRLLGDGSSSGIATVPTSGPESFPERHPQNHVARLVGDLELAIQV